MGLKSTIRKWKKYSELSNLGTIARRKFFNNLFDGVLTCAGIVSGIFIIFLNDPLQNAPKDVIVYGLATALAIGISGLWGAFLSEEAERKKKVSDLKKEMVILREEKKQLEKEKRILEGEELNEEKEKEEIQKAMITPIKFNNFLKFKKKRFRARKNKKTLLEKAELFATIVASIIEMVAVLGVIIPLLPFFFGTQLTLFHFISSYIILLILLILLGIFLGKISGKGKIKYAIHLVLAGIVILMISLLLGIV